MNLLIKKPSAWIPIVLTILILAVIFFYLTMVPVTYEPDEGVGAHLFQIWLVLEVFTIGFFGIKWLPRHPKEALGILAIQIAFAFLPLAIVFSLSL